MVVGDSMRSYAKEWIHPNRVGDRCRVRRRVIRWRTARRMRTARRTVRRRVRRIRRVRRTVRRRASYRGMRRCQRRCRRRRSCRRRGGSVTVARLRHRRRFRLWVGVWGLSSASPSLVPAVLRLRLRHRLRAQ